MTDILGIDAAKSKFDAALLLNGKYKSKSFENRHSDFESLAVRMKQLDSVTPHACLNATGSNSEGLSGFLFGV